MNLKKMMACCTSVLLLQSVCLLTKTFAAEVADGLDDPERFRHVQSGAILSKAVPVSSDELTHNGCFNDDYVMIEGIDVSKYQPSIDWESLAEDGVDFAIIRLGFRGYGEAGALVMDNYYRSHMEGAKAAGIDTGVYFFTQAITPEEAVEEANFVLEVLQGIELEVPVYLDVESISAEGRMEAANLTPDQLTENLKAFCSTIENAGYEAGVYANMYWLNNKMNAAELENDYSIWLANYTNQTVYEGAYDIWQYTNIGTYAGIEGCVDKNIWYSRKVEYAEEDLLLRVLTPMTPEHVGDGKMTYTSSDESIALVDRNGCITPLENGTVTITATSSNGTSDSIEVTIDAVPQLTLHQNLLIFNELGAGEQLNVFGTEYLIYWSSSDESVVSVTENGYAESVGYGTATITVRDIFGNQSDCTVFVTDKEIRTGDCNVDGKINAMDAATVLTYAATSGASASEGISDMVLTIYDINMDGAIDAMDASEILFLSANNGTGSVG
ncbi:MAG: Ig-like domain-containing protein [Oscillospiraceae bacterium]|nr:Ig-like domain-containing protein [Oscillospiraceae bacterium]